MYPERKDTFRLYTGYPYHITVYVGKHGILFDYKLSAEKLTLEIKRGEKRPKLQQREGYIRTAYATVYFKRILNEPEKIARREINDWISYEHWQEEEEEYWQRWEERYFQEEVEWTVKSYISYIKKAYAVQEKSSLKMKTTIYALVKNIHNLESVMESYIRSGCITLFDVLDETMDDLESSMFLTIHGRYEPAMALLRRYLETRLCALYFDAEIKKYPKNSKTYGSLKDKRDKWIEKPHYLKFTGDYGILDRLIDPDTDYIAYETLKKTTKYFQHASFRKYVESIYRKLSKFVHYGGTKKLDDLRLEFSEFKEDKFKEWSARVNQILEICNLLTVIKFPEIVSFYEEKQQNLCKRTLKAGK